MIIFFRSTAPCLEFAHASIIAIRENSYTIRDHETDDIYHIPMASILYIQVDK